MVLEHKSVLGVLEEKARKMGWDQKRKSLECRAKKSRLVSIKQQFSDHSMLQDHLGCMLKCRLLGRTARVSD